MVLVDENNNNQKCVSLPRILLSETTANLISAEISSNSTMFQLQSLPPEVESGNVEYKLKLVDLSSSRIEHLVTQMNWRLREGDGEAIYEMGVEDNGTISGVTEDDLRASLCTLRKMAAKLDAETIILKEHIIKYPDETNQFAAEVLVKRIPGQEFIDIRVACLGNVDVGKSTLLSVLSYGDLDDGRGKARLKMFRHLHEIKSGRTSCISQEILGFDSNGQILNCDSPMEKNCNGASKLITFLDLAGHKKYIKTTILGLTGYSPELVMLVIAANRGLVGATKEHLGLAVALNIPFLIVINKIDICSRETTDKTVSQLERILKSAGCKKIPIVINDREDVHAAVNNFTSKQVTPLFKVSSVTGLNLELLSHFFYELPSRRTKIEIDELNQRPFQFQIDKHFSVPDVGTVIAGTVRQGTIKEGDELIVGPSDDGCFHPVVVSSLHRNQTVCRMIQTGQTACIAAKSREPNVFLFRRGQVLLNPPNEGEAPVTCIEFEAEILLLFHSTKISRRFQCIVHIGNVVQTALIKSMNKESISSGQRAKVVFRFIGHPEYIRIGDRVLFREGRSKGIGEIIRLFPYHNKVTLSLLSSDTADDNI